MTTMRRGAFALVPFVLALAAAPAVHAQSTVTFRASLDTSTTHNRTVSIGDYLKKVEEASGGTIKTQLFHSGQLYKDVNVAKALREGSIEMAAPGVWVLSGFVPDTDLVQLPVFYGQPLERQLKIFDGAVGQQINAQIERKLGVKVLGPWLELGFGNYYSTRKPLNDFADLAGMKIRTSGGAGQFARAKFFGAIPNLTPWPDVPLALAQGTFDALSTTNESVESAKLFDSGLKYAFEDHQFLGFYIPMVGINQLFQLNNYRILSLAILLPFAVRLFRGRAYANGGRGGWPPRSGEEAPNREASRPLSLSRSRVT